MTSTFSSSSSSFVLHMTLNNTCPLLLFQLLLPLPALVTIEEINHISPMTATTANVIAAAMAIATLDYAFLVALIQSHCIQDCHVCCQRGNGKGDGDGGAGEPSQSATAATAVDWNMVVKQEKDKMNNVPFACACTDSTRLALLALPPLSSSWEYAQQWKMKLLQTYYQQKEEGAGKEDASTSSTSSSQLLDVLLLDFSFMEHWLGMNLGVPQMVWQSLHAMYLEYLHQ